MSSTISTLRGDKVGQVKVVELDGPIHFTTEQDPTMYSVPPIPLANFTNVINAPTTLAGTYTVNASSTTGTDHRYNAFDGNASTRWLSGGARYDANGLPLAAASITSNISTLHLRGEWVEIQLPVPIQVSSFDLIVAGTVNQYGPRLFTLAGSTDGFNWDIIYRQTSDLTPYFTSSDTKRTFASISIKAYRILRFIGEKVNSDKGIFGLTDLMFYGKIIATGSMEKGKIYVDGESKLQITPTGTTIATLTATNDLSLDSGIRFFSIVDNTMYHIPPTPILDFTQMITAQQPSGLYTVYASSTNNNEHSWRGFDGDINTRWISLLRYDTTTSLPLPTASVTSNVAYNGAIEHIQGEWIELQVPVLIQLIAFDLIVGVSANSHGPRRFVLIGSTDRQNWEVIYRQTSDLSPYFTSNDIKRSYSFARTKAFTNLRFIGEKVGSSGYFSITELDFYGYILQQGNQTKGQIIYDDEVEIAISKNRVNIPNLVTKYINLSATFGPESTYPPMPMASNLLVIEGIGRYYARESSFVSGIASYVLYDSNLTNRWISNNTYDSNGFPIAQSPVTLFTDGAGTTSPIYGEWAELELPNPVKLSSFDIVVNTNVVTYAPRQFAVVGSMDRSTWGLVYRQTTDISPFFTSTNSTRSYTVTSEPYLYFRIIGEKVSPRTGGNFFGLTEWVLRGSMQDPTQTDDGTIKFDGIQIARLTYGDMKLSRNLVLDSGSSFFGDGSYLGNLTTGRLFVEQYPNKIYQIRKQCASGRWLQFDYRYFENLASTDFDTRYSVYRMYFTSEVTRVSKNEFEILRTFTFGGEWECAIREVGKPDFMGGTAHGNEFMTSFTCLVDGNERASNLSGAFTCKRIDFFMESTLTEDGTSNTVIKAYKKTTWEITAEKLTLRHYITWVQPTVIDNSFLAMFPINEADAVGNITDCAIRYPELIKDTNLGDQNGGLIQQVVTKSDRIVIWGSNSGISCDLRLIGWPQNRETYISNNGRKVYATYYTRYNTTQPDEVWSCQSDYYIELK